MEWIKRTPVNTITFCAYGSYFSYKNRNETFFFLCVPLDLIQLHIPNFTVAFNFFFVFLLTTFYLIFGFIHNISFLIIMRTCDYFDITNPSDRYER